MEFAYSMANETFLESELGAFYMLHPMEYVEERERTQYALSRLVTRQMNWRVYQTLLQRGSEPSDPQQAECFVTYAAVDNFLAETGQSLPENGCQDEGAQKRLWFLEQVRSLLADAPELVPYLTSRKHNQEAFIIRWAEETPWADLPAPWKHFSQPTGQ